MHVRRSRSIPTLLKIAALLQLSLSGACALPAGDEAGPDENAGEVSEALTSSESATLAADFMAKLECDRQYNDCVSQCAASPQFNVCRSSCVRTRTSCYSRAGYDADGRPKRPQQSPIFN